MITKVFIGLAVGLVIFLIVVALQPSTFRIARSILISASAPEIFPHVNDLKKAQVWSPWTKLDPAATYTFTEASAGVGASSSWAGNNQIGEGRQTIVESRANEFVGIRLDFKKPFESTCMGELSLKPSGAQSEVTWSLSGENNFISKAFCLFMNQDQMIGGPFEEGLANLKALVEKPAVAK